MFEDYFCRHGCRIYFEDLEWPQVRSHKLIRAAPFNSVVKVGRQPEMASFAERDVVGGFSRRPAGLDLASPARGDSIFL